MREFSENHDITEIPKEQEEVPSSVITQESKRKLEEPEYKQERGQRDQDLSNPDERQKKKLDSPGDIPAEDLSGVSDSRSPKDKLDAPRTDHIQQSEPKKMSSVDPRDQVVDRIMNSDLPIADKKDLLNQYRSDLLSSQPSIPENDSSTPEDGAPVKVLRKGLGDTGISHHDYLDELGKLDEGIHNWQDYQQGLADEINNMDDQIRNNPDLSDSERRAQLDQNADRRALAARQYDRDLGEMMGEREGLLEKIQGMNPSGEGLQSFYSPEIARPESGDSLRAYEMPEGSRMVDSAKIDMSDAPGMDDPNFWNHHGREKGDYMALAGQIPEVQERLDAGESLDALIHDPDLGPTARQYYSPDNMIHLMEKPNGEYAFIDDGRHRVQAAKELGFNFPAFIEPDEFES